MGPVGGMGQGRHSTSRALLVRTVGTAAAQNLWGSTLDCCHMSDLWSGECERCGAPGLWPGRAGEGRGRPGELGQLEAAGEAML